MKTKLILIALAAMSLVACGQKSPEEKISAQTALVHGLTDDERSLASINAKQYFEKEWLPAGSKRGQLISCRPSDSNFNGLVSCTGYVPQANGTFTEKKMYCGYRKDLVGCSDEDTVK